jgi:mannosyl-oligosaccharide alpha-1,2-mannosidase
MLRLRRYRVYAILAVFIVGALYHFKILRDSAIGDTNSVGGLRNFAIHHEHEKTPAAQTPSEEIVSGHSKYVPQQKEVKKQGSDEKNGQGKLDESPPATFDHAPLPKPIIPSPSISQPEEGLESAAHPGKDDGLKDAADSKVDALPTKSAFPSIVDDLEKPGKGRLETPMDPLLPKIYWSKLPEHFPIPSARIIQLPTGSPKQIPQIQYTFADESPNDKISREQKLGRIKKTFEFSWAGYKEKAWMQDELSPVSGAFRNPFCGWAATLVDSLDTLWLMGMKEEFEEAANAVKDIDFTTSVRRDIPLFETVIRYLGGLLAAYDLSGGKYRVFLEKAIELAEVLMGAFDTPNRMPMTYYFWKP